MDWQNLLVFIFEYVSNNYKSRLWPYCERMSNNNKAKFTDEELITIYLFSIIKKRFEIKDMHDYVKDHLLEWFPALPSYPTFITRLNRLDSLFPVLAEIILKDFSEHSDLMELVCLIDSMPVIMANAKRSSQAKVAGNFANKGYCSSKGIYYYGVKVHVLGIKREGTLPLPDFIGLTPASNHDLTAYRHIASKLEDREIYADKAYSDQFEKELMEAQNGKLFTPVKKKKGQKKLKLLDSLFSTSVSRVRQPIESLFNWFHEKTKIQTASKVRSYKGLMIHIFGKIAAAMLLLTLNP